MMVVALTMLAFIWLLLTRTRMGLVIQAALSHPEAVQSLGHNVPRVYMLVFGVGAGLAGLAGVIGGSTFLTEPAMAASVGSIVFVVVVVGGLGSLSGALLGSILIGVVQTFAVSLDYSVGGVWASMGLAMAPSWQGSTLARLTVAQVAPILPYAMLVLLLILRPRGLLGSREG
jgi:branched-chain amino acid transport system permease protein